MDFFIVNCFLPCPFFQNNSRVFPVLAMANVGSCVGPKNKLGHAVNRQRQLMQVTVMSARGI